MFGVLIRVIADAVVVAIVLFVAAGTVTWPRAWVLVAVLLVVRTVSAVAVFGVNPALLRERAAVLIHRHQPWTDRLILLAFMATAFVGVPAVAALDAFHWHMLPSPPLVLASVGLGVFAFGWTDVVPKKLGKSLRESRWLGIQGLRPLSRRDRSFNSLAPGASLAGHILPTWLS